MRKQFSVLILTALIMLGSIWAEKRPGDDPTLNLNTWLDEEVVYIISEIEREVFVKLRSDRERELYIEAFWKQRDPTPGTPENEFRNEHYQRINYANRMFGRAASKPGWMTDRGRIYIILGEPRNISRFIGESQTYNSEIWFYQGLSDYGLPPGFNLVFYQKEGIGEYVLYIPSRDGPQAFMPSYLAGQSDYQAAYQALRKIQPDLARVSLSLIPGEPTFSGRPSLSSEIMIQNIYGVPQRQFSHKYAEKFLLYKDIVEVEYTANYIDSDSLIKVIKDPSGMYFIHYIVELIRFSVNLYQGKYSTQLKVNLNVSDDREKTIHQYEKSIPVDFDESQFKKITYQPFHLYGMFPLIPGQYKLSILVKNEVSKEFAFVEEDIVIPANDPSLELSPLILGYQMDQSPPESDKLRPFMIGRNQIHCEPNKIYLPQDNLFLFFQILGLDSKLEQKGFIKLEISKENRTFLSRTRKVSDYQNRMNFIEEISLEEFPPGHYWINVSLLDGDHEVLSGRDRFDVTSVLNLPRPWINKIVMPPSDDPIYSLMLGRQFLNMGEAERAKTLLEKAFYGRPNELEYALNLVQVYFALNELAKAKQVLLPFSESPQSKYEFYFFLARTYHALGELNQAISFYNQAGSRFGINTFILNSLGDCYFRLGELEEASAAWDKSLELNPDQPEIVKKMAMIKK